MFTSQLLAIKCLSARCKSNIDMRLPAIRINPLGMCVLAAIILFFTFLNVSVWFKKHQKESAVVSLRQLLAVSIAAAEEGGDKVRAVRFGSKLQQKSKGKTKEGANEPLTAGDIQSHIAMLNGIRQSFPDIQIVSEEHENVPSEQEKKLLLPRWDLISKVTDDIEVPAKDVLVWIDPLDATQEYTENLLDCVTTMVCIAVKGRPTIGIIHQPFNNYTVWSWVNHGMSTLGETQTKKPGDHLPNIIVSRSHAGKVGEVAKAAFGSKIKINIAGGAGYKSVQVATGNADAYIHVTHIKKWDICAGNALLNSLGGQMTTLDGQLIDYSKSDEALNTKGLLATLRNHQQYLDKLSSLKH